MDLITRNCIRPFVAAWLSVLASTSANAQDVVKIGTNGLVSDAVFYIASDLGYFAGQSIKVEFVHFPAGPQMVAPLGTGQIDVGGGATSAGLFNAVARGINMRAVADKGSTPPGYEYFPLLVRKDLIDSGRIKIFADFKGLKVADGGKGGAQAAALNAALMKGGLTYNDVQHVYMGYAQHVAALANGSVDFSVTAEPMATMALKTGKAVKFPDQQYYPNQQAAVLLYSGDFIQKRHDVASRFMIAYVQAARFYNGALKDGGFHGKNAGEVIQILTRNTKIDDPALYRQMVPNGVSSDARLNLESLEKDYKFYAEQNYIEKPVEISNVVDTTFVENANKVLGSYQPTN
jgi:NitT/TauT family transport system substrate-binding protein